MHTPTHLLIGTAALTKPGARWINIAAVSGALLPDLPMYVMFAFARMTGVAEYDIWEPPGGLYWNNPWKALVNAGHSLPIFLAVLALAFWFASAAWKAFAYSGLLHIAFDFPVHREDGHAHFWPFSNWVFISPVSYYERDHYGGIVMPIEIVGALVLTVVLWRRFSAWWVRGLLVFGALTYVGGPMYFMLSRGG